MRLQRVQIYPVCTSKLGPSRCFELQRLLKPLDPVESPREEFLLLLQDIVAPGLLRWF